MAKLTIDKEHMMKTIYLLILSLSLLSGCGVPQSALDDANKKIADLEAKLELEKAKQVVTTSSESAAENKPSPDTKLTSDVQEIASNSQWSYDQQEDKMTGGTTYLASVVSTNTVNFSSPYNGIQNARLTLRSDVKYGKDVIFRIEKGQILCNSYDSCTVLVRFDDEKPTQYSATPPSDNSSETIFISNYGKFVDKIRKAKLVRISPTVYQEGSPVFEFDVHGFEQNKFKPSK
jgi:outer membrane lipoprotein-sorting protein